MKDFDIKKYIETIDVGKNNKKGKNNEYIKEKAVIFLKQVSYDINLINLSQEEKDKILFQVLLNTVALIKNQNIENIDLEKEFEKIKIICYSNTKIKLSGMKKELNFSGYAFGVVNSLLELGANDANAFPYEKVRLEKVIENINKEKIIKISNDTSVNIEYKKDGTTLNKTVQMHNYWINRYLELTYNWQNNLKKSGIEFKEINIKKIKGYEYFKNKDGMDYKCFKAETEINLKLIDGTSKTIKGNIIDENNLKKGKISYSFENFNEKVLGETYGYHTDTISHLFDSFNKALNNYK